MPMYKIYAGLGGGFGGANLREVVELPNDEEAFDYARELAVEEYRSYGGLHGLDDFDSIVEEYIDSGVDEKDIDHDEVEEDLNERMDSWLDFEYVEVPDDYELTEDELDEIN